MKSKFLWISGIAIIVILGYFILTPITPEPVINCTPEWQCTAFGNCDMGSQFRTCTDLNNCMNITDKPDESQSCSTTCTPEWQCTNWIPDVCISGTQTRTCTDNNHCSVNTDKPDESKSCVISGEKENYLILTTNSLANSPSIAKLVNLRQNYNIIKKFVDGKSNSEIKDIITEVNSQYPLSYIVVIGASTNIPVGIDSDLYYADLTNDGEPDVAYGRIPFSKEEYLSRLINKEVQYENSKFYTNKKILFMAGDEAVDSSSQGWQTATYFNNQIIPLMSGWTVSKAYYGCSFPECMIKINPSTGSWGCDINKNEGDFTECDIEADKITLNKMNGNLFVTYTGHGGNTWMPNTFFPTLPTFNFGFVYPYLNNTNQYFILTAQSCSTITYNGDGTISMIPGIGNTGYFTTNLLYYDTYGAVAVIGSPVTNGGSHDWGIAFHRNIKTEKTLGNAWLKAVPGEQMTILGDPALTIN